MIQQVIVMIFLMTAVAQAQSIKRPVNTLDDDGPSDRNVFCKIGSTYQGGVDFDTQKMFKLEPMVDSDGEINTNILVANQGEFSLKYVPSINKLVVYRRDQKISELSYGADRTHLNGAKYKDQVTIDLFDRGDFVAKVLCQIDR